MGLADRVKPVSYVQANAAEIIADLNRGAAPMIVTQDGEARAVLQDIGEYDRLQETLALLKIVALGRADVAAGRTRPAEDVVEEMRARLRARG